MSVFPELYKVFILSKTTLQPIKNIAIKITLFATRKNNYHFIPAVSDEHGCICFTQEWLNSEIEKEINLFIMDYSCRLSNCLPQIEVRVMSQQDIDRAVYGMTLYKDYFNTLLNT